MAVSDRGSLLVTSDLVSADWEILQNAELNSFFAVSPAETGLAIAGWNGRIFEVPSLGYSGSNE